MTDPVVVTMEHVRKARLCSRGARAFLARHGFDWDEFLARGIEADKLEAIGDAMAMKAVEEARNGR